MLLVDMKYPYLLLLYALTMNVGLLHALEVFTCQVVPHLEDGSRITALSEIKVKPHLIEKLEAVIDSKNSLKPNLGEKNFQFVIKRSNTLYQISLIKREAACFLIMGQLKTTEKTGEYGYVIARPLMFSISIEDYKTFSKFAQRRNNK